MSKIIKCYSWRICKLCYIRFVSSQATWDYMDDPLDATQFDDVETALAWGQLLAARLELVGVVDLADAVHNYKLGNNRWQS